MAVEIITGDCRRELADLPSGYVQTVVTSPPYFGLRDYDVAGQIGLEEGLDDYIAQMVGVFREVRRVLKDDGTLWLNIGDSYAGSWGAQSRRVTESENPSWHGSQIKNHPKRQANTGAMRTSGVKPKDLYGVPWRVAFALQADGWYLRQDIIWSKPNPMPESVADRCTKAHEYMFLLSKSESYYFDAAAISEALAESSVQRLSQPGLAAQRGSNRVPGKTNGPMKAVGGSRRNKRSVWTVPTQPFKGAHFATFPIELIWDCIRAGSRQGDIVLDPFGGAGTTAIAADRLRRDAVLIELNPAYVAMAEARLRADAFHMKETPSWLTVR